jgi:hypothetical protein
MDHNLNPERLARTMTNDPDVLNEMLYGFHVNRGSTNIDQLIWGVEHNYLDWNITDSKFQTLFYRTFPLPQGGTHGMTDKDIGEVIVRVFQTGRHSQEQELVDTLIQVTKKQLATLDPADFDESEEDEEGYARYGPQSQSPLTHKKFVGQYPSSGMVVLHNGATFNAAVIIDGARSPDLSPNLLWLGLKESGYGPTPRSGDGLVRALALPELYTNMRRVRKPHVSKYFNPRYYDSAKGIYRPKWINSQYKHRTVFDRPYRIITVLKKNVSKVY